MLRRFVEGIFANFDWTVLDDEEREALRGGIKKHASVLRTLAIFVPFQVALGLCVPEILALLTVASFIALLLGGAWFAISFQNVSSKQLAAGVADFITKRMFRGLMLSFSLLPIGSVFFLIRTLIPELISWDVAAVPLWFRYVVLVGNAAWILLILADVYQACVAYDAADSLLGDGFPTLMRGAKANAQNLPMLESLQRIESLLEQMVKAQRGKE